MSPFDRTLHRSSGPSNLPICGVTFVKVQFEKEQGFEVLAVVMSERMIEACLIHQMLPPLIVHPAAHHVRDFILYEYESDTLRAYALSEGWGWHCQNSLVRTAQIAHVDETLEQESLITHYTKFVEQMEEEGTEFQDTYPMLNTVAIHHRYTHTSYPNNEEILEEAVKKRIELINHPLFEKSASKIENEPLVKSFFMLHAVDMNAMDLLVRMNS